MSMWIALALAFGALYLWQQRANEIFCLSVRDGRLLLVRGRLPAGLLGDFHDVLREARRGTVRAVKGEGRARLKVSGGIDQDSAQRLRNIFQMFPVSRLRAAPVDRDRSLGQILGIAWLAWMLERR